MNQYAENQKGAYPPPPVSSEPGPYVAPPPMGYPTADSSGNPYGTSAAGKTQSRGDGFWKGCCAAICCCCVLDACF